MPPARVALWVSTIGALAVTARSIFVGPVPLWFAGALLAGYAALSVVGVLVPAWQMFGDVIVRGGGSLPVVALTFDDGPHPDTTPRILSLLEAAGARATFFVLGEKAERHPELVRAIADAGHGLGVHGYRHYRLYSFLPPKAVEEDIERARRAVEAAAGIRPRFFRPPVGQVSPRTAAGAKRAGVEIVVWSARGYDGLAGAKPEAVTRRITRDLRPGAIVLLHDAAERDDFTPASIEALPAILDELRRRGLRAETLDAVLDEAGPEAEA